MSFLCAIIKKKKMLFPVFLPKSTPKCKYNVGEETLRLANSTVLVKAKTCLFGAIIKK
jgi:hypothetical protein